MLFVFILRKDVACRVSTGCYYIFVCFHEETWHAASLPNPTRFTPFRIDLQMYDNHSFLQCLLKLIFQIPF
jgi:hypothetical protein